MKYQLVHLALNELLDEVVLFLLIYLARAAALVVCNNIPLDYLLVLVSQLGLLHRLLQKEQKQRQLCAILKLLEVDYDVAGQRKLPFITFSYIGHQVLEEVDHDGLLQWQ